MSATQASSDEKKFHRYTMTNPRNSLAFSWLNDDVDLSAVFNMVTEAPTDFIARDIFSRNSLKLFEFRDESDILKSVEIFKSGHLVLLSQLDAIAQRTLYSRKYCRLDSKSLQNFVVACLSVISEKYRGVSSVIPPLLSDLHTIQSLAYYMWRSISDASTTATIPRIKANEFPNIRKNMMLMHSRVSERFLTERKVCSAHNVTNAMVVNLRYFLFYYTAGFVRKYVRVHEHGYLALLSSNDLSSQNSLPSSASDSVVNYLTPLVRLPTKKDFEYEDDCLVFGCAVMPLIDLCRLIIGKQLFALLPSQMAAIFSKQVTHVQAAHRRFIREFSYQSLPWVADKSRLFLKKGEHCISLAGYHLFIKEVVIQLMQFPHAFTKTNMNGLIDKLIRSLRAWNNDSPLLEDKELCRNPSQVQFVDLLPEFLANNTDTSENLDSIQAAAYQNIMFFALFYVIHWMRLVLQVKCCHGESLLVLKPRSAREIIEVIDMISEASDAALQRESLKAEQEAAERAEAADGKLDVKPGRSSIKEEMDVDVDSVKKETCTEEDEDDAPHKKRVKIEKRELDGEEEDVKYSTSKSRQKKSQDRRDVVEVKPEPIPDYETVDVSSDDDDVIISSVVPPPSIPSYLQKAYDALNKTNATPIDVEPSFSSDQWTPSQAAAGSVPAYLQKALEDIRKVVDDDIE